MNFFIHISTSFLFILVLLIILLELFIIFNFYIILLLNQRKSAGLTLQYVADEINTSKASYAHYENVRYLISTSFIFNLSEVYDDLSIDEMLGRKKG